MDIIYCPKCDQKVYIFRTEETMFFEVDPQVVYIPETGELKPAQVTHQCRPKDRKRSILSDPDSPKAP